MSEQNTKHPHNASEVVESETQKNKEDEEKELLLVGFHHKNREFVSVPTIWVVCLELVILIGYNIFLFVNISGESNLSPRFTPFLFRCFLHVFVLFVLIVTNRYKTYFHRRARRHGYLQFYQQTRTAVKLPFIVWALGNAVIVILMSVWPQNEKIGVLEPLNALQVVVTLENICLIPCLVIYSYRILRHNGLQLPPDAHSKLYQSLSSFSPYNSRRVLSFSSKDFGEEFDTLADVGTEDVEGQIIEKQAEYIRYLEEQKTNLSKQIVELTQKLESHQVQNCPSLQEIDKILAAKNREIQSLVNQLLEKDAVIEELQAGAVVQITPSSQEQALLIEKYKEEIKKLKTALEVERQANVQYQAIISKQRDQIEGLRNRGLT